MRYFAYGSNMCSARLRSRIEVISCLGKAKLPGYDLYCDKASKVDGSAKFTIAESHLNQIYGVVFEIPGAAFAQLDEIEGDGYKRLTVKVDAAELGILSVFTYQALKSARDPRLLPYEWYLAYAVEGAIEHELPEHHVHRLQKWACKTDSDKERAAWHRGYLKSPSL